MIKIGRNDLCPCGSGKKFKRCCLGKTTDARPTVTSRKDLQLFLLHEIDKAQIAAMAGRSMVRELGVFVLFSSAVGDAWLLEVSEMDALRLAVGRAKVEAPLEMHTDTVEINWSHTFAVENKKIVLTSYDNKDKEIYQEDPAHAVIAAIQRIKRKYSATMLDKVHLAGEK